MRINRPPGGTSRAGGTQSAQGTGRAQAARFGGMVNATAGNGTEEANRKQSALMSELAELAAELSSGKATKEEASRRFVKAVLKRQFGAQRGKGVDAMEETLMDYVESDEQFVSRLQAQLKRIAKDNG